MRTSEKPEATTAGTRSNYWLFSIVLLAALVRFYALGALPPSLFIDEVWSSFGPQVFYGSADPVEWPLPLTMSQIVTGQLVTYELAGDSAFWTRSSTAGLGVVGIVLTFVLVSHWLGRRFALLTALAMAIAPWAIHLSRYAVPAMA